MSPNPLGSCLPPSSSLPSVRELIRATDDQITLALRNLQALYCPLRLPSSLPNRSLRKICIPAASTPTPVDSGYVSEDEDDDAASEEAVAALRADPFERTFAARFLTSLLARAEEMDLSEESRSRIIDDAAFILSSFSDSTNDEEEQALTRDFAFHTASSNPIHVRLNDAPLSGTDHTDVGLQSWGASIVLSRMLCADPERFGFASQLLPTMSSIIELGAGTGLVSLTLAKLLPNIDLDGCTITATDYHPTVLENCRTNVVTNFPGHAQDTEPVQTAILDWSCPHADLKSTAKVLIASDVVYAPEHAAWLRDCAAHLLVPDGTFWLMVTVRKNGKFEGIPLTVEAAFDTELCPKDTAGKTFKILEKEQIEKRRGIGRGDEIGYNLYRIGWA